MRVNKGKKSKMKREARNKEIPTQGEKKIDGPNRPST